MKGPDYIWPGDTHPLHRRCVISTRHIALLNREIERRQRASRARRRRAAGLLRRLAEAFRGLVWLRPKESE